MRKDIKKTIIKILIFPIYVIHIFIVLYFIGYTKDVWDKWVYYIDKIIEKRENKQ